MYEMMYFKHKSFIGIENRHGYSAKYLEGADLSDLAMVPNFKTHLDFLCKAILNERVGVLLGEFVVMENGMLLFDRDGQDIIANIGDDESVIHALFQITRSDSYKIRKQTLIDAWDSIGVVDDAAVMATSNSTNYFHFAMDFLPRFRLLDDYSFSTFLIPAVYAQRRRFQSELLTKATAGRSAIVFDQPIRARNPILTHGNYNRPGSLWLRQLFNMTSGDRRYYVRRVVREGDNRPGGGLSETPELMALLLDEFGFDAVDFGSGQYSVEEQLAMIRDARVIIGPHGANLTNVIFAKPPLLAIEVLGTRFGSPMLTKAWTETDLDYHIFVSDQYDSNNDIIVDCDRLRPVLQSLMKKCFG